MPVWWGRKSHKKKEDQLQQNQSSHNSSKSAIKDNKEKSKSFEEVVSSGNSSRCSKDFGHGGSGFLGFELDSHPLPRPLVSPTRSTRIDHGVGFGSGSSSGSSVSSYGSSDDPNTHDHHGHLGAYRFHGETKIYPSPRSPNIGPRGPTSSNSPLHRSLNCTSSDSPTGKSPCHRLPLPPGSPTSPSALHNTRNSGVVDTQTCNLSKWKKGKLLGRGTFGHVYLGFNSESGQMCAMKEVKLLSDDQTSKECLKQLNQEINLLSQLSHPNIVQYYGSELDEETLSVYLEYASGGSIHKLLQEYGPFKEPVIQNYTRQILSGLAYLHGKNTMHRDIKGANILVDPNGVVKVADFGMAKHITSSSSILSFKGSPFWMAPEVVINTNGYSLAVDIWSLGCTVLEMVTSKPPWSHQYDGVAAIFKIGNSKDIPQIPDHLSNDAKSFLKLCLQRDPAARPTAAELLRHPFIRDLSTIRAPNINLSPATSELNFDRASPNLRDQDYIARKQIDVTSGGLKSPRDTRMITSLPVSPCSSPLRQSGPTSKSWFLSPPHPTYALAKPGGHTSSDYLAFPKRPNTNNSTSDLFHEVSLFKAQTPIGSPRTRTI